MRPFLFLLCVAPLDCFALITTALVFSLMTPLVWFIYFFFKFVVVVVVVLFWGWWVGKILLSMMGKRQLIYVTWAINLSRACARCLKKRDPEIQLLLSSFPYVK